ncbi:JNK1/MAPK8-associated membrane protein-like [Convolutriloba macropyga]|uniref:JNK1/MAPK8-associated membrane protein-like n=1 Tax=Convolutriloba macropyga TaxID=536237 RepID=UPI003F526AD5
MSSEQCFCPGRYCGCFLPPNSTFTSVLVNCGKCPRSSRVDVSSGLCKDCDESPEFYDWLYISSVLIVLFVSHISIIDWTLRNHFVKPPINRKGKSDISKLKKAILFVLSPRNELHCALILVSSIIFELICSLIATLLFFEPFGSFSFHNCGSKSLADWYPIFFNPRIDFTATLYCTQEVVYPLYSLVLTLLLADLVFMVLIRPVLTWKLNCNVDMVSYLALYFIPILMLIYAIGAGILYYSFPYLFLIFSVASVAFNLCLEYTRCYKSIWKMCAPPPPRIIALVLMHWWLHAFSIISITRNESLFAKLKVLSLTPLPTLFFFLTIRFTDPCQTLHRTTSVPARSIVGRRLGSMPQSSSSIHSATSSVSSASRNRHPNGFRNRTSRSRHASGDRPPFAPPYASVVGSHRRWNPPNANNSSSSFLSVVFEQHQTTQNNSNSSDNEASTSANVGSTSNSVAIPNVTLSNIL